MLPAIQSGNLQPVTEESFNADQLGVSVTQLFASISSASRVPESLILNFAAINADAQETLNFSDSFVARRDQKNNVVKAEDIDAAIENGSSLAALFASDPGSLGFDLEDARILIDDAKKLGLTIDASLHYPVIVISYEKDKEAKKQLVWMSDAERQSLNAYSIGSNDEYASYTSRLKQDNGREIHYILLDDLANFRITPQNVEDTIARLDELNSQKAAAIDAEKQKFLAALEIIGSAVRWLLDEIIITFRSKRQNTEAKNEKILERAEEDRLRLIQSNRLISEYAALIEKQ